MYIKVNLFTAVLQAKSAIAAIGKKHFLLKNLQMNPASEATAHALNEVLDVCPQTALHHYSEIELLMQIKG